MNINDSGQFLETPKQSPDSKIPPPLDKEEDKDNKEVKEMSMLRTHGSTSMLS